MLLKALIVTIMVFASSVGVLRASVVMENYLLLVAGLALAVAAIVFGLQRADVPRAG